MTADKEQQRSEFAKYTKFFTIRLVQAVVQSRLGEKQSTNCGILAERNDWFNLKIEEYGEITNEINRGTENLFPPDCPCVSVEFQLQTCDGEKLPLECWALQFDQSKVDESIGVRGHFYHQLGTLLKSTLSASRVTPSYRNYVRRQGPDSFIVCYRIFRGEPNLTQLGDGYRSVRLGNLASPFGSLLLDFHYRTHMVISSGGTTTDIHSSLKENYYEESAEPGKVTVDGPRREHPFAPLPAVGGSLEPNPENSPPEACFSTFSTSPASMELPWFVGGGLPGDSPARRPSVGFQMGQTSESSSEGSANWPNKLETSGNNAGGSQSGLPKNHSSGTLFKMDLSTGSLPKPSSLPERTCEALEENKERMIPFSALLTASSAPTVARAATDPQIPKLNTSLGQLNILQPPTDGPEGASPVFPNATEEDSSDDSFVKVEINPLFSTSPEKDASDLGSLVRAFKLAPPQLNSFDDPGTSDDPSTAPGTQSSRNSMEILTAEIHRFQEQQTEFEKFVNSLSASQCEDED